MGKSHSLASRGTPPSDSQAPDHPVKGEAPASSSLARPYRRVLRAPLDALLNRQLTKPVSSTQTRNLRLFWLDGIWTSASDGLAISYIPLYALAYGATAAQVGIIAAIGNLLGALALFPGAQALERVGRRMPIILLGIGVIYRLPLLLLALLPFLGLGPAGAIPVIVALAGVRSLGLNFANPAWTALAADMVPAFMRGRYFSLRNLLMGIATLVSAPLAGWLISSGGHTGPETGMLQGYQFVFLLSFLAGCLSTWYFSRLSEPLAAAASGATALRPTLAAIVRASPALGGFIASAFVWNLSLQVASPYFNVYMVQYLGGTEADVGIVTALSALSAIVGQVVFGRLLDRKGSVRIFLATGFPIVLLPVAWAFYDAPWEVAVNNVFGGFLWAGFNLANFNLLLLLTPDDQRARAVALYQTAVFAAAVLGPLIGGYVADNISFRLVFILSGVGRLAAMLIFVMLGMRAALSLERRSSIAP